MHGASISEPSSQVFAEGATKQNVLVIRVILLQKVRVGQVLKRAYQLLAGLLQKNLSQLKT